MATGTDVLNFILPNPAWAAENHLAVVGGGQPIYTFHDEPNKRIWLIKGTKGFPFDMNTYDEEMVYQSLTDIDTPIVPGGPTSWTLASMFKAFASTSWPNGNGGIAWAQRYLQTVNPDIVTEDSTYRIYSNCTSFTTETLGGPTAAKWEGPYELGDVIPAFGPAIPPTNPTMIQTYNWGGVTGQNTQEQNVYVADRDSAGNIVPGFGLVQWEDWALQGGIYVLKQTSLFSELVAGGVPALDFPCAVPTI